MEERKLTKTEEEYFPVQLDSLRLDSLLDFALYLKVRNQYVLFRAEHLQFSEQTRSELLSNKVHTLYLKKEARPHYLRYVEKHLTSILRDPSLTEERKAQLVYDTSTNLLQEVLENPTSTENIKRATAAASNTVSFVLRGRESFRHLVAMTSYDYRTYTHSVNVCLYTVALAEALGYQDQSDLNDIGIGALLHDIGKSKIDTTILNKGGPLTPEEYDVMKHHPVWGVNLLRETSVIPEISYELVLHHHERVDGSGYPDHVSGGNLHEYARLSGIADVFDALTTRRPYKGAIRSFDALDMMGKMPGAFDVGLYREFVRLMGQE